LHSPFFGFDPVILSALAPQPLQLVALPVNVSLISFDLILLPVILIFLTLELIANERARTESQTAANRSSRSGMADGTADDAAHRGASEGADACAFFPRRQWPACAAGADQNNGDE
jgi:hypothetical protein